MSGIKKIHRIYFGFDGKPDPYDKYLETWCSELPDYEVMHWDSTNLPIDICEYTKALFKEKDGPFLSDYYRWYLLREHGGIYLDADIEVVNGDVFNKLIEELSISTEYDTIIGIENRWGYTAHSVASRVNANLPKFMCEFYETLGHIYHLRKSKLIAPQLIQPYFFQNGLSEKRDGVIDLKNQPLVLGDVKIFPQEYFSPLGFSQPPFLEIYTINSCLCHHFGGSWLPSNSDLSLGNLDNLRLLRDYIKPLGNSKKNNFFLKFKNYCFGFWRVLSSEGFLSVYKKVIKKLSRKFSIYSDSL